MIPSVTDLRATTALNIKATDIKHKMPNFTYLATKFTYLAVLNAKATEIENKVPDTISFNNTQEFNRLTKISLDAKMKEARGKWSC